MNLRIILHLLRTDWLRLRKPVMILWLLLLVSALPCLIAGPGDLRLLQWMNFSTTGNFEPRPADLTSSPGIHALIFCSELASTILALIIASALGAQCVKQLVTPVRRRERLSAITLSLLLFMVLPLWLLAAANLLLHGFSPEVAALAAGATALSAWLLLGLVAALGAWLPSPWLMLAGIAALSTSVGFISEFYKPLNHMLRNYPLLPILPAGPKEWLFGVLSVVLLLALFPWFGHRWSAPWRIALVTGLVILAGLPAVLLPPPEPHIQTDPNIQTASILPLLRNVRISTENDSAISGSTPLQVSAYLDSIGCPPDLGAAWEPASGWISQDGKRVASVVKRNDPLSLALNDGEYLDVDSRNAVGADSAAMAALPGQNVFAKFSRYLNPDFISLGFAELPTGATLSPDRQAELHMEFKGTVFRYEKVWDVPLETAPTVFHSGNLTWRVRRFPSDNGQPRADVMVTHPALGSSKVPDEVRWDSLPIVHYRLYFHLPATGEVFQALEPLLEASGPLFSGAGWHRRILSTINQVGERSDLSGLRLVLLKPVPVARITTSTVTRFRPWMTGDISDFALMHRFSVDETIYRREWFSQRPDPRTCTEKEFARWLRIPASVLWGGSGPQRDLACYAPRFPGLMTKVGNHPSVAEGLHLGLPESLRDEIIGGIDSIERPQSLAEVAWDRGWLENARDGILRRFNDYGLWQSDVVMAVEDPSTYRELISRFLRRPERETYEKLRLLPGMDHLLGPAITKATSETKLLKLRTNLNSYQNSAPFGPFLYAAKRGDAAALAMVLVLYKSSGDKAEYAPSRDLGYIIDLPDIKGGRARMLSAWLSDKNASSFRFDPLLRIWKPLP